MAAGPESMGRFLRNEDGIEAAARETESKSDLPGDYGEDEDISDLPDDSGSETENLKDADEQKDISLAKLEQLLTPGGGHSDPGGEVSGEIPGHSGGDRYPEQSGRCPGGKGRGERSAGQSQGIRLGAGHKRSFGGERPDRRGQAADRGRRRRQNPSGRHRPK